jgi:hypothetical protein
MCDVHISILGSSDIFKNSKTDMKINVKIITNAMDKNKKTTVDLPKCSDINPFMLRLIPNRT